MIVKDLPSYAELPRINRLKAAHAWQVFGEGDELGRLNLLTPETVAQATSEVRKGSVFNLCLPLNQPNPPFNQHARKQYQHTIFSLGRNSQDDYVDSFYMQASTQWDGFRHARAAEFGFYGGMVDGVGADGDKLGIEKWADHGIVGRGVLADVGRYLEVQGRPLDLHVDRAITVDDLKATLRGENVELRQGDILLLRTGFIEGYLSATGAERQAFYDARNCPGLVGSEDMAEFLWDSGLAAIAADNPAVEDIPGDPANGSLHRRLIPLLGFALGEAFDLGRLAMDCQSDGIYTALFMAAPLNLPGGVGSPGNALAIK
jgi:kynurenine formamidase